MPTLDPGLRSLREVVCAANLELHRQGLVLYTFGNASGIDRERGLVAIKPSGIDYQELTPDRLVIVDLQNRVVEGSMRPSSDTRTHTALYRAWTDIGGVAHTHSIQATAWCQAGRELPCLGTTHADHCHGPVPCTVPPSAAEIEAEYEEATGQQILNAFIGRDHRSVPMVLVARHGPFTWGASPAQAVYHAVVLERLALLATVTRTIDPSVDALPAAILDKHYFRKHGPSATYGQHS
ncbi:MAG: L-ribulose-5-phosphate 4-epimerase AraD [Planctomycetes bacterium]|nr:L-ribulose-5-phosphate 4-epimerase AraD [Planctomycetota bacterium]